MSERLIRTLHQGIDEVPPGRRSIALGTFDGVHLGHQAVIRTAHAAGQRLKASTMAATFHPRPATVIRPGTPPAALSGITERIRMLYQAGADEVVMMRFTPQLAELSAAEFVEQILVDRFGAVAITVGEDFRFGHDRLGGVEAMRALCDPLGVEVDAVELLAEDGDKISSSRIRGLISEGEMQEAAKLLGRLPSIDGVVGHGDKRGREIGFPTANLSFVPGQQLPAEGVYAGWATISPGSSATPRPSASDAIRTSATSTTCASKRTCCTTTAPRSTTAPCGSTSTRSSAARASTTASRRLSPRSPQTSPRWIAARPPARSR